MTVMISSIRRFLSSEDGPTAVEYALLMGFIVLAIFGIVGRMANNVSGTFNTVNSMAGSS